MLTLNPPTAGYFFITMVGKFSLVAYPLEGSDILTRAHRLGKEALHLEVILLDQSGSRMTPEKARREGIEPNNIPHVIQMFREMIRSGFHIRDRRLTTFVRHIPEPGNKPLRFRLAMFEDELVPSHEYVRAMESGYPRT